MAAAVIKPSVGAPRSRTAGGTATPAGELLVLVDEQAGPLSVPEGLRVRRTAEPDAFRRALASMRRGVVLAFAPLASADDIRAIALTRSRRSGLRAMVVNAPEDARTRIEALALGIDDALAATAGAEEIAGRLEVLAAQIRHATGSRLPVGTGVELDLTARALRRDGRLVHLRPLEFRLLEELARNPGRPMSRATLLRRVWRGDVLEGSRTIDVHIRWLRAKVERDPERPIHLLTVRGVGYQLELETEAAGLNESLTDRQRTVDAL